MVACLSHSCASSSDRYPSCGEAKALQQPVQNVILSAESAICLPVCVSYRLIITVYNGETSLYLLNRSNMQRVAPVTVTRSTKKNSFAICNLRADLQHMSPLAALWVQYAALLCIAGSSDTQCGVGGGETSSPSVHQIPVFFLTFGLAFLP